MDERARQLLQDFIREKLNGTLENIRTFNIKTLRGDDKFGCPGRYFDCDDTEIMRAIYVVLWGDVLPELSMDTLGNTEKYRGDTMNSFHTMFGHKQQWQQHNHIYWEYQLGMEKSHHIEHKYCKWHTEQRCSGDIPHQYSYHKGQCYNKQNKTELVALLENIYIHKIYRNI